MDLRAEVLDHLMTAGIRAVDFAALARIEPDLLGEWERNPSVRGPWAVRLTLLMALSGRFGQAISLLEEAVEVAVAEDDVNRAFQLEAQIEHDRGAGALRTEGGPEPLRRQDRPRQLRRATGGSDGGAHGGGERQRARRRSTRPGERSATTASSSPRSRSWLLPPWRC